MKEARRLTLAVSIPHPVTPASPAQLTPQGGSGFRAPLPAASSAGGLFPADTARSPLLSQLAGPRCRASPASLFSSPPPSPGTRQQQQQQQMPRSNQEEKDEKEKEKEAEKEEEKPDVENDKEELIK